MDVIQFITWFSPLFRRHHQIITFFALREQDHRERSSPDRGSRDQCRDRRLQRSRDPDGQVQSEQQQEHHPKNDHGDQDLFLP